ncbi:MAG: NACHT domain-containing protein [Moorea sp. SIO3I7]|uniref:NACHT domain-containing protein n=1 Tax=Moorena sp. SIO3I8 TaxID=2607833 RepID=UPI0013C19A90|nr:NACHT domain-containing protein [Moorena sp. SIO3I8]NEN97546.1 NACHT domain-containing protein [Moorena sp. SIO3I7]NEO06602.1 NACHT domain-containing protein [Moorena sp. SIO3I8]
MNLAELLTNPNVLQRLLQLLLGLLTCIVGLLINRFDQQKTLFHKIIVFGLCVIVYVFLAHEAENLVSQKSAQDNTQWFQQVYWILGIGYVFAFLTMWYLFKTSSGKQTQIPRQIPQAKLQRWRQRLLAEIAADVNNYLYYSLDNHHLIKLVMPDQREQLDRPEKNTVNPSNSPPWWKQLPKYLAVPFWGVTTESQPGQKVIEVFNQKHIAGKLLILGAPGSGKTTMLLDLAKDLITGAQHQPNQPIPIIAELSDWKDNKQPIAEWLAANLKFRYNLPEAITQEWITTGQLLPLLDGLDELGLERQRLCVQELNQFLKDVPQIVVCCREEEYKAGEQILEMRGAVCLQPLTDQQIENYLKGLNILNLWPGIKQDSEGLLELARMPLLLNLIPRAYPDGDGLKRVGRHFKDPKAKEDYQKQCRRDLFENYINRKLNENHDSRGYSEEKTRRWLGWLAKRLKERQQTEFLIEKMQHIMFNNSIEKWLYKLIMWLMFGLIFGLIMWLMFGLMFGLVGGLSGGLLGCIFDNNNNIQPSESIRFSWQIIIDNRISLIIVALMFGLLIGLLEGLSGGLFEGLSGGLSGGLFFGLILGLVEGLSGAEIKTRNKPNQGIKESAKNIFIVSLISFPVTLLLCVLLSLVWVKNVELLSTLIVAFGMAILMGFLVAGTPVIQHFVLRFILWGSGSIPWDYAHFLSYATERRLIKQVGGRYRFIHDLLREHFSTT